MPVSAKSSERSGQISPPMGFTFLELLVVVFVISLTMTLVVINMNPGEDRTARLEAERFKGLVHFARDQSVILGYPLGIRIDDQEDSYRFGIFREDWQPVSDIEALRPSQVARPAFMQVIYPDPLPTSEESEEENIPQIVAEPHGVVSIFEVAFLSGQQRFTVKTNLEREVIIVEGQAN